MNWLSHCDLAVRLLGGSLVETARRLLSTDERFVVPRLATDVSGLAVGRRTCSFAGSLREVEADTELLASADSVTTGG